MVIDLIKGQLLYFEAKKEALIKKRPLMQKKDFEYNLKVLDDKINEIKTML